MQTVDLNYLRRSPPQTLLDLGCGEGRHALGAQWLQLASHIVAVDISAKDVRTAQARLIEQNQHSNQGQAAQSVCHLCIANGLRLPFAEHSFDTVICSEVLEHIPDYQSMLTEIHRVLKPGGTLAISVPRAWPERVCWWLSRAYHQVEGGHVRIFNARQLRAEIEQHCFDLRRRHWAHALHVPYWWLRCLFWRENIQVAPVRWYHRLLVWDLMSRPWLTQTLERLLNPLMGKSVVMYFEKQTDAHFD